MIILVKCMIYYDTQPRWRSLRAAVPIPQRTDNQKQRRSETSHVECPGLLRAACPQLPRSVRACHTGFHRYHHMYHHRYHHRYHFLQAGDPRGQRGQRHMGRHGEDSPGITPSAPLPGAGRSPAAAVARLQARAAWHRSICAASAPYLRRICAVSTPHLRRIYAASTPLRRFSAAVLCRGFCGGVAQAFLPWRWQRAAAARGRGGDEARMLREALRGTGAPLKALQTSST